MSLGVATCSGANQEPIDALPTRPDLGLRVKGPPGLEVRVEFRAETCKSHRAGGAPCFGFRYLVVPLVESRIIYVAREQKTYDHVVWPGLVFELVVLFPISRLAGDSWSRIVAVPVASSVAYPVAWRIAAPGSAGPALMIAEFAFAGFLRSFVLSGVLLLRRPCGVMTAIATVILGAAVGGLMGANLRATMTVVHWPVTTHDALGLSVVLWQAVVGASLGWGVQRRPKRDAEGTGTTNTFGDA